MWAQLSGMYGYCSNISFIGSCPPGLKGGTRGKGAGGQDRIKDHTTRPFFSQPRGGGGGGGWLNNSAERAGDTTL